MKTIQKLAWPLLCILFLGITSCEEKIKKPQAISSPKGIISLNEAKTLCDNYETRRINGIIEFEIAQNSKKEFIPTQFIDFDFETILQYVKYVEERASKAMVKPDSLRIYLGNYGPDGEDPNKNTVFILPTAKINGERGGFYIDDNGKAKLIRDYWPKDPNNGNGEEQKSKTGFSTSLDLTLPQDGSLIFNHGSGGPPPTGDF